MVINFVKTISWEADKYCVTFCRANAYHLARLGKTITQESVFAPGKVKKTLILPASAAEYDMSERTTIAHLGEAVRTIASYPYDENRGECVWRPVMKPNRHQRHRTTARMVEWWRARWFDFI